MQSADSPCCRENPIGHTENPRRNLEWMLGCDVHTIADFEILLGLNARDRLHLATNHRITNAQLFDGHFPVGRKNRRAFLEAPATATRPSRGSGEAQGERNGRESFHDGQWQPSKCFQCSAAMTPPRTAAPTTMLMPMMLAAAIRPKYCATAR